MPGQLVYVSTTISRVSSELMSHVADSKDENGCNKRENPAVEFLIAFRPCGSVPHSSISRNKLTLPFNLHAQDIHKEKQGDDASLDHMSNSLLCPCVNAYVEKQPNQRKLLSSNDV